MQILYKINYFFGYTESLIVKNKISNINRNNYISCQLRLKYIYVSWNLPVFYVSLVNEENYIYIYIFIVIVIIRFNAEFYNK